VNRRQAAERAEELVAPPIERLAIVTACVRGVGSRERLTAATADADAVLAGAPFEGIPV